MAGVKGRSGRKRLPVQVHVMRGTYRSDRHGPLPAHIAGATALKPQAAVIPDELLAGLADDGAALVRAVYADFEPSLTEQVIVRSAAEARDRVGEVRRVIARDGVLLTTSRGGKYAHPLLKIEKASTATFLAAMRQLGLPAAEVR